MNIRKLVEKVFTENVKQTLFSMIQLLFVGFHSTSLFIENNPKAFSQFGAIIIVWSLIQLSISRTRYSSIISDWDNKLLTAQIDHQRYRSQVRDRSLHLTFNIHASVISQICHHLGRPSPFVGDSSEALESLVSSVEKELTNETSFMKEQEEVAEKFKTFRKNHKAETDKIKSWSNLFMKIEVILIAWGTLQNAYGADLVTWFHS